MNTIIEQIHNEFNNAGNDLLKDAKAIINSKTAYLEKARRLHAAGFTSVKEVDEINRLQLSKETIDLVTYYQQSYPFNKFITDERVALINKKYNLICAPVSKYKGFVPENKLREIEQFKVSHDDLRENMCVNLRHIWSENIVDIGLRRAIKKYFPNGIPQRNINSVGGFYVPGIRRIIYAEEYDVVNYDSLFICAPRKDFDLRGLSKIGSLFNSLTSVTIPDPVVLQPVIGGYLIVTAWGDEASDETVVNQKLN